MYRASVAGWVVFVVLCVSCGGGGPRTASTAPRPKASEEVQKGREAVIERFQREGLIGKIEGETVALCWVGPKFRLLKFEDKVTVAHVVFMWTYNYPQGVKAEDTEFGHAVHFLDDRSGKLVGQYSPRSGLQME